jgi:hypothetical protein
MGQTQWPQLAIARISETMFLVGAVTIAWGLLLLFAGFVYGDGGKRYLPWGEPRGLPGPQLPRLGDLGNI